MDLEIVVLCEESQRKRKIKMNFFTKQNRLTDIDNLRIVTKVEEWGDEIIRAFGINLCILLYLKWTYCIAQGSLLDVMWQPRGREV